MTPGRLLPAVWILCLSCAGMVSASKRTKRELRFPTGSSLVAAVSVVTFLPKGPTDGFAHFVEFDLGFPFPDSFTINKMDAKKKASRKGGRRAKRNLKEEERRKLAWKLEDAINRLGFNGTSCMRRFRCELRHVSPENSLLEKLLTALFDTSGYGDEDCEEFVQTCPVSLLHAMMHSEHVSGLGP